ncbi:hypothetical protein [Undibacterium danionis]|uniref:Uncharacterized protein n=1 Tax=Undibacterium danionis TaxID=1812100 RepID=A0ABV6ICY4_9BURK
MAILEGDIKLLKSQVMDDVDEGGGRATGVEIVDGASNGIFPDISELDRAYGRVNLRKVFPKVNVPSVESYYGANMIISDPPDDPKVTCTLFTTRDGFDKRSDAKLQLESYVVAGPLDNMIPYGQQVIGQRAVLAYQRVEHAMPEVGQVFALVTETGVIKQQYFRIQEITSSVQTFEDGQGTFDRRVILITTSDPLRYTFPGEEPQRIFNSALYPNSARIRKTSVVDLARYYGAQALTQASLLGSLDVKVDSLYTSLVPSSTIETPVVSATIQGATITVASGTTVSRPSADWLNNAPMYFGGGIAPRSLTLTAVGGTSTYNPKTDDGAGNIVNAAGKVLGAVDYLTGSITPDLTVAGAWTIGSHAIAYTYGAAQQQSSFTDSIEVTLANRGSVYTKSMQPHPSPGTAFVDFMALGKWYRLRDVNGDGQLKGDETAYGSGSVNYTMGTLVVTLGALPDVGSRVIFSWGSKVDTFVRSTSVSGLYNKVTVAQGNIDRSSLSVTLTKAAANITLTDSGSGALSGGGLTGKVNYSTGEIVINGARDYNTNIVVSYSRGAVAGTPGTVEKNFPSGDREPDNSLKLLTNTLSPIKPRTLTIDYYVSRVENISASPTGENRFVTLIDDGSGNVMKSRDNAIIGTINYTTGVIQFQPRGLETLYVRDLEPDGDLISVIPTAVQCDINIHSAVLVKFQTVASMATVTTESEMFNPPLKFKISENEKIVLGSLVFTLGASRYIDRAGQLFSSIDLSTGSGVLSGTVDHTSGEVSVTKWDVDTTLSIKSCLTFVDGRGVCKASFRTTGAPIRPGSFYLQATAIDGTLVTATSNADGDITGAFVSGKVKNGTGAVTVRFGKMVAAAGNEAAWWYDAASVVGGQIFKPLLVNPETIQYNTVVTSTLPLDASVLGIDPVRLPSDGRVPILRTGDMCVIHHTTKTTAQSVSNSDVISVGRTRLSRMRVYGANGALITSGYTADLDAGTVTFTDVSGYSQPVRVEHRIEDMSLLADAQINGSLRLTQQLTHDFPIGSYISSALIIGDMKARVPINFDQATWTGNAWSDAVNGSPATPTFNDALYPIVVSNTGAITERWVVQFTSTTAFQVIGEHVGVIAIGNTATDCVPLNPASGDPYFSIPALGWGSGWAAGNILRFNTVGALFPVWISRTIQQGPATSQNDSFTVLIRGDIDRP